MGYRIEVYANNGQDSYLKKPYLIVESGNRDVCLPAGDHGVKDAFHVTKNPEGGIKVVAYTIDKKEIAPSIADDLKYQDEVAEAIRTAPGEFSSTSRKCIVSEGEAFQYKSESTGDIFVIRHETGKVYDLSYYEGTVFSIDSL